MGRNTATPSRGDESVDRARNPVEERHDTHHLGMLREPLDRGGRLPCVLNPPGILPSPVPPLGVVRNPDAAGFRPDRYRCGNCVRDRYDNRRGPADPGIVPESIDRHLVFQSTPRFGSRPIHGTTGQRIETTEAPTENHRFVARVERFDRSEQQRRGMLDRLEVCADPTHDRVAARPCVVGPIRIRQIAHSFDTGDDHDPPLHPTHGAGRRAALRPQPRRAAGSTSCDDGIRRSRC